tara:strand:+ start:9 stop:1022 length:1014 start_codon:yes stop_codon:yes gene_type:complete
MPYITTDNINRINAELTNFCNAACPMCARYFIDGVLNKGKVNNTHTTLNFLKEKIGKKIISQLKHFSSCGNLGDASMNPQCLDIYTWLRSINKNCKLELHTNGGARNKEFWVGLAKLNVSVVFAIDGLENTNHLYRRNVKWQKLMDNIKSFIEAGGDASWQMLVFKHNESQIDSCKKLSIKLGFRKFDVQQSARWSDFDHLGNWRDFDKLPVDNYFLEKSSILKPQKVGTGGNSDRMPIEVESLNSKNIICKSCDNANKNYEIYIAANGDVSPCCWLGDLSQHESKNIISDYKKVNLNHSSLEEILNGEYFKALERGIKGEKGSYRLQTCYFTCGLS